MYRFIIFVLLCSCGTQETTEKEIAQPYQPISYCIAEANGVCIFGNSDMNIDPAILSKYLTNLQDEVNQYYPGLDFDSYAEFNHLAITYKWAGNNTHIGNYANYSTNATVWLRQGDNVTPKIACMDRYFWPIHEVLHFIVERYMDYDDRYDSHNVPYIFNHWANLNGKDNSVTVEGRLYTIISTDCSNQ